MTDFVFSSWSRKDAGSIAALALLLGSFAACTEEDPDPPGGSDDGGAAVAAMDSGATGGGVDSGADAGMPTADAGMPGGGDPAASTGDAVRGGALYDNWASVKMATPPTTDHPLWAQRPDTMTNTLKGADTWRCKECHGWDYKGVQGAYGSGSHKTGFAGIATSKTVAEVVDSLKVKHGYGTVLTNIDLSDLAAFVKEGTIEPAQIIDANKKFIGDAAQGMSTFTSTCQTCHGANGLSTMLPGFTGTFDEFPGKIANENPWEFQHKVRFGQPGSAMPPQMRVLSVAQVGSLGVYVQTLPTTP
jgi:mono/diheme cytochrome c family protein